MLLQRARLLALAKFCSSRYLMSYEDIAKELQVSRDEAEQYIVKAVQSGLVEGHMDQIKEEFAVAYVNMMVEWEVV